MHVFLALYLWVIASWACSPSSEKVKAADWQRVPVAIELRLAKGAPGPGLIPAAVYGQAATVYLQSKPQLSHSDIARVEAVKTRIGNGLDLEVWLTKTGAARMADLTAHHIGDSLAVLVNSVVVSVPIIRDTLDLGTKLPTSIGVPMGPKEAGQLAQAVSKTWPAAPRRGAR
ncbi:MAG: SecDF P1 head subdomain-containing protein [Gemmatimonadales bacterium]